MKKFIIEFLNTFRIGPQHVRLGVAKYADSPNLEFDLTTYSDVKTLEKAIDGIRQIGGGTETGRALDFMGPLFDKAMASRGHKVTEYLVVITDGKSSDEVKIPAEKLRAQGVVIYAIGVKNADEAELKEISGDPKKTFFVNNFDALKPIKDDIVTDICSQDGKEIWTRLELNMHVLYVAVEGNTPQHRTADSREMTGSEGREMRNDMQRCSAAHERGRVHGSFEVVVDAFTRRPPGSPHTHCFLCKTTQ